MNFKHLHYFWVAARAGGVVRAGEQLHTTPQTLSGQIKLLEERLGRQLFRKSGRKLELTEDGRVALGYADEIFHLGGALEAAMREKRDGPRVLDFRVGVADAVPKTMAYRLLEPALNMAEPVRNERINIGLIVMIYLGVLFVFAYALKRAYWKDIH